MSTPNITHVTTIRTIITTTEVPASDVLSAAIVQKDTMMTEEGLNRNLSVEVRLMAASGNSHDHRHVAREYRQVTVCLACCVYVCVCVCHGVCMCVCVCVWLLFVLRRYTDGQLWW
jgi:hypothetical protein